MLCFIVLVVFIENGKYIKMSDFQYLVDRQSDNRIF